MSRKTNGALGVVVIAVALVGALFGAYFAGITGEEHDVVKYNYLADISGLFEYDKSPQYIEFDPSSNYTGYYSSTSGGYWPEEMSYTPYTDSNGNPRVNNYKINLPPSSTIETTASLASLPNQPIPSTERSLHNIIYCPDNYSAGTGSYSSNSKMAIPNSTSLSTLLDTLTYDGKLYRDYDLIRIASPTSIEDVTFGTSPTDSEWIVFYTAEWASYDWGTLVPLVMINPDYYDNWDWHGVKKLVKAPMCMSCEIDMNSRMVTMYWDNDFENVIGSFSLAYISVAHGDRSGSVYSYDFTLGDLANVTLLDYPDSVYLDPMQGVQMED